MQWLYGCGIADDSTIRSYNHYSVDGTDFLHLNTNNLNWTAFNEKAEIFKNNWDIKGHEAQHMISYLKTKCIDSLKEYVSHLNTSQKTDAPTVSVIQKHSPSPEVDVELRETLPNQDGSFQKRSILKVPAEELQKHNYTCVIQHSSLEKEFEAKGGVSDGKQTGIIVAVVVIVAVVAVIVAVVVFVRKKKNFSEKRNKNVRFNGLLSEHVQGLDNELE
ncbi:H-2 class I histocompatibility antigen, L-D alpha chain-like [Tachysurus ichikawai]